MYVWLYLDFIQVATRSHPHTPCAMTKRPKKRDTAPIGSCTSLAEVLIQGGSTNPQPTSHFCLWDTVSHPLPRLRHLIAS